MKTMKIDNIAFEYDQDLKGTVTILGNVKDINEEPLQVAIKLPYEWLAIFVIRSYILKITEDASNDLMTELNSMEEKPDISPLEKQVMPEKMKDKMEMLQDSIKNTSLLTDILVDLMSTIHEIKDT